MSNPIFLNRFVTYLRERFDPKILIPVALLFGFGTVLVIDIKYWTINSAIFFLFLLQMRIFDEFKDFGHDAVYYPERPVSRGLISLDELKKVFFIIMILEIVLTYLNKLSIFWFGFTQLYAALLLIEALELSWLKSHFVFNLAVHEFLSIPLFLLLSRGLSPLNAVFLGFNLFLLEIARKSDPNKKVYSKDSYLINFGQRGVYLLVSLIFVLVSLTTPGLIGFNWQVFVILVISLLLITKGNFYFKDNIRTKKYLVAGILFFVSTSIIWVSISRLLL